MRSEELPTFLGWRRRGVLERPSLQDGDEATRLFSATVLAAEWDEAHGVVPAGAEERELLNCRILGDPATDAGLRTAEAAPERSIRMQRAELNRLRTRWDSPRL